MGKKLLNYIKSLLVYVSTFNVVVFDASLPDKCSRYLRSRCLSVSSMALSDQETRPEKNK